MALHLTASDLPKYLEERGFFSRGTELACTPAGDGNINWVRRVRPLGGGRAVVVKQARPALERFPEYRVSTERIVFEARYFERVAPLDPERLCPQVLGFDEANRVLVLEDVGEVERLDAALARGAPLEPAAAALGAFLGRVHAATAGEPGLAARFQNGEMRALHGEHIFRLPFQAAAANDFGLAAPLAERARSLAAEPALRAAAARADERYHAAALALVHGDPQAGNVLLAADRPRLLDAEIAHVGDPAFDLGTLLAHLALPALAAARGESARPLLAAAEAAYRAAAGGGGADPRDAVRFGGFELLRRCIGAARVACVAEPEPALRVLDAARRWILAPEPPAALPL